MSLRVAEPPAVLRSQQSGQPVDQDSDWDRGQKTKAEEQELISSAASVQLRVCAADDGLNEMGHRFRLRAIESRKLLVAGVFRLEAFECGGLRLHLGLKFSHQIGRRLEGSRCISDPGHDFPSIRGVAFAGREDQVDPNTFGQQGHQGRRDVDPEGSHAIRQRCTQQQNHCDQGTDTNKSRSNCEDRRVPPPPCGRSLSLSFHGGDSSGSRGPRRTSGLLRCSPVAAA